MFDYTDHFDTTIDWYNDLKHIAQKAIEKYGDKIKQDKQDIETEIDGYLVRVVSNDIIHNEMFPILWPKYKDTECQININISKKGWNFRGYGFIYHYINNEWVKESY